MHKLSRRVFNTTHQNLVKITTPAHSGLAKNRTKVAAWLLSSWLSGSAFAAEVSIQGIATGDNAVSVGADSFATSDKGAALGAEAVATGNNFNRDQFKNRVNENAQAVSSANNKQTEVNNKNNQLTAANNAITELNHQIDDLTRQQEAIREKIKNRDKAQADVNNANDALSQLNDTLTRAETGLEKFKDGTTQVHLLNFTQVLNTLDWGVLTETTDIQANRRKLAQTLKEKVTALVPEIAAKPEYTDEKYLDIIEGYVNRQGAFQGSVNYLASDAGPYLARLGVDLYNNTYFNAPASTGYAPISDDHVILKMKDFRQETREETRRAPDDGSEYKEETTVNILTFLDRDNNEFTVETERNVEGNTALYLEYINDNGGRSYELGTTYTDGSHLSNALRLRIQENKNNPNFNLRQELNTLTLIDESAKKLQNEKKPYINTNNENDIISYLKISGTNLGEAVENKLNKAFNSVLEKIYFNIKTTRSTDGTKVQNTNHSLKALYTEGEKYHPGGKVEDLDYLLEKPILDRNIGIITMLKDQNVSTKNLITGEDIHNFRGFYKTIKKIREVIDWNDPNAAIDLNAYQQSLDKVLAFNEKIDQSVTLYEEITQERQKPDADQFKIDSKTAELIRLRQQLLDGVDDPENYMMGIKVKYTPKAKEYLEYGKAEADQKIDRINKELKLYNPDDKLVKDFTEEADRAKKAFDEAKRNRDDKQKELDTLKERLRELALTPSEEATDEVKRQKEQEKADREADKVRLEEEISRANEELDNLREAVRNSDLRNLGLRSQARGANAFASGNDSIAFGTNATATQTEAIAIGKESNVSGEQSIAIGSNNTVTGSRVFVAGNNNTVAANNVVAIGNNISVPVTADNNGAVVLGDGSTVSKANPTANHTIQNVTYEFAGKAPITVVSVGSKDKERQLTNVAAGRLTSNSTDVVNGSQLYAVIQAVNNLNPSNPSNPTNNGAPTNIEGDINIEVTPQGNSLKVGLKKDIQVDSLKIKDGPQLTDKGVDAGDKKVRNVQKGEVSPTSKEAINGAQLYQVNQQINHIDNRVTQVENKMKQMDKRRKAGTASALAVAGLPQAHREGQSGVVASVGQYQGQTGLAVGYTRISDNGRWSVRASFTTNTGKEVGGQMGVGYFW